MKKILKNGHSQVLKNENEHELSALEFTTIGIACHALCLIEYAGVLQILANDGQYEEKRINEFPNPHLVKAALITLVGARVLYLSDGAYFFTKLGEDLSKHVGLLTLPLVGYRKLIAKQLQLLKKPQNFKQSDIDFATVALSSINFGEADLDPLLISVFEAINPKGTICDLGCGTGEKLAKICGATGARGLGIEQSPQVIQAGKHFLKNCQNVEIIKGDLTDLNDIWEDVDIAMMSFVYHDIASSNCNRILESFKTSFPRMRCLVVVDIVSLSEKIPTIMPGFDYVHGLQGITPRNYEETLEIFERSGYRVFQEFSVPNMPNTFIWILMPNKNINNRY